MSKASELLDKMESIDLPEVDQNPQEVSTQSPVLSGGDKVEVRTSSIKTDLTLPEMIGATIISVEDDTVVVKFDQEVFTKNYLDESVMKELAELLEVPIEEVTYHYAVHVDDVSVATDKVSDLE